MDYLTYPLKYIKDLFDHYRHMTYYYFGYRQHQLRLAYASKNNQPRLSAVKTNNIQIIQSCILRGQWQVDDIVSENNMTTMLHQAVVMDRRQIFAFLVRQGANLNCRDRNGMTPLLKAAALGREYMVVQLINQGVNPHHKDPHGFTPLQKAVLHQEWEIVNILQKLSKAVKGKSTWNWPN